ncbi:MAG: hypothetical protein AABM40_04260 [Chloroflexota bacterium]
MLVGTVLIALALPALAEVFIRLSYERYIWVISQAGPCSYLGSVSLIASILFVSFLIGFGALGILVATRGANEPLLPRSGMYFGIGAIALGALLVGPDPHPLAFLLGCLR